MNEFSESNDNLIDAMNSLRGGKQIAEAAEAKVEALLEAKDKRIITVTEEREFWRERVEGAEKEREEFRRRFNLERTYTEGADKRIAELETKLASMSESDAQWAVMLYEKNLQIVRLEAKLATPVRLPQRYSCEGYHIDEAYLEKDDDGDCFNRNEVITTLREQGFIVEGDA